MIVIVSLVAYTLLRNTEVVVVQSMLVASILVVEVELCRRLEEYCMVVLVDDIDIIDVLELMQKGR